MGLRDHGYYGYAFVGTRLFQVVALSAVVGIVGHFASQDTHAHISVPAQLVGTLVISSLALLWSLLSFTAYDDTHFPYAATSGIDLLFMVPFVVVAAVLGGPLGSVACSALPTANSANSHQLLAIQMSSNPASSSSSSPSYIVFIGDNQTTCFEIMAVWGLVIALCVLLALSGCATGLLFLGRRRALAAARAAAAAEAGLGAASVPPAAPMGGYVRRTRGPASESGIEMGLAARGKWSGSDDDDDDRRSQCSSFYFSGDGSAALPATPPYPSAGGRAVHPRLSSAGGGPPE